MVSANYFVNDKKVGNETYTYDPSTTTVISSTPLLQDPYESRLVYVKKSPLEGAGEGLFAKIDLPADRVVSFYSGIRTTHKIVDKRAWRVNNNTIELDEEVVIDVPQEYASIEQ